MTNSTYYVFALITLVLSAIVLVMAVARLHCHECKRSRLKYTVVLLAALAAGLQPYFLSRLPGLGHVLLILSVLWLLVDGAQSFKTHQKAHASNNDETMDTMVYGGE